MMLFTARNILLFDTRLDGVIQSNIRGHLLDKEKVVLYVKTGDLFKEVQFIWNFL
jgi:hypothetical protein